MVLLDLRIVLDPELGRDAPEIKRAVEFQLYGIPYYAEFDRLHRCTEDAAPQSVPSPRARAMHRGVMRCASLLAAAAVSVLSCAAAGVRSRTYEAPSELVWEAAVEVSNRAFLVDAVSREDRRVRFRCGQLRRYCFEATVIPGTVATTRVVLQLRSKVRGIEREAWREGARYLQLVEQRLGAARNK